MSVRIYGTPCHMLGAFHCVQRRVIRADSALRPVDVFIAYTRLNFNIDTDIRVCSVRPSVRIFKLNRDV
jgi:hypothetical protein